ncbi:hypothetical protein ACRALDRAFT_1081216 [Sodiomyces alcalophilus JCM 7366]|uniref:uncharacterized protein n=1 Tax=Sodiomyces alcalophilus JCM 7366 TaxID=591952 RepID=UPI0039B4EF98
MIAANRCYHPVSERHGTAMDPTARDDYSVSDKDTVVRHPIVHHPPDSELHRRQSIRFVNNSPGPRRSASGRTAERFSFETGSVHRFDVLRSAENGASTRISSRESYVPHRPTTSSYTEKYLQDMAVHEPRSSTSRYQSTAGHYYFTGDGLSPLQHLYHRYNENMSPVATSEAHQALRAPRSMSFLKTRQNQGGPSHGGSRQASNDLAIHLAKERLREQVQEQERLGVRPSMLSQSLRKGRETSTGFPKSLRNPSNASAGISLDRSPSNALAVPKEDGLRKKARKVSSRLKLKLKTLFRRGKSGEEVRAVAEESQSDERPPPPGNEFGTDDETEDDYMNIPVPEPEIITFGQVLARVPSIHTAHCIQTVQSCRASIVSASSDEQVAEEKSRVTSWATSGVESVDSDKTCQRLAVITEGDAQPMSVYSESVYSQDKPHSVHAGEVEGSAVRNPTAYSPATITSPLAFSDGPLNGVLPEPGHDQAALDRMASGASSVN